LSKKLRESLILFKSIRIIGLSIVAYSQHC
jgi:hypothetical protein